MSIFSPPRVRRPTPTSTAVSVYAAPETRAAPITLCPTIFHEDWWLNAATDGAYSVVEVENGGRVVGRLPYMARRKWGQTYSVMPTLTHFLGPAVDEGVGSSSTRFLKRVGIVRELIEQLPAMTYFHTKCHHQTEDVIPFQAEGFQTSVQFTHVIAPAPADDIWKNMRDKTRNVIRRSREHVEVETLHDPHEFLAFYSQNLNERSVANALDEAICLKLIEESQRRGRGRLLATRGKDGALTAANFCVWDETMSYYLMSTRTQDSGNGDISMLVWDAIQDAAQRGLTFDFDGLSSHGGVVFFAGFGAVVSPRYVVTRAKPAARLLLELRDILRPNRYGR